MAYQGSFINLCIRESQRSICSVALVSNQSRRIQNHEKKSKVNLSKILFKNSHGPAQFTVIKIRKGSCSEISTRCPVKKAIITIYVQCRFRSLAITNLGNFLSLLTLSNIWISESLLVPCQQSIHSNLLDTFPMSFDNMRIKCSKPFFDIVIPSYFKLSFWLKKVYLHLHFI